MTDNITPELTSDKVILRKMNMSLDLNELFRIMKNPEVHKWTGSETPANIVELMNQMESYINSRDIFLWSVIGKDIKKIVGYYWIAKPVEDEKGKKIIFAELEKIGREYWRKGYTKEARKLVYNYCFKRLKAHTIYAQAWENNINSCRSMEYAGYVCYDREKKYIDDFGDYFYECYFKLTESLWQKSRLNNEHKKL